MTEVITRRHLIGLGSKQKTYTEVSPDNVSVARSEDLCAQTDPEAVLGKLSRVPGVKVERLSASNPNVITLTIDFEALKTLEVIKLLEVLAFNTPVYYTNDKTGQYISAVYKKLGIHVKIQDLQVVMSKARALGLYALLPAAFGLIYIASKGIALINNRSQNNQQRARLATRRMVLIGGGSIVGGLLAYNGVIMCNQIESVRDLYQDTKMSPDILCGNKSPLVILHIEETGEPNIESYRKMLGVEK